MKLSSLLLCRSILARHSFCRGIAVVGLISFWAYRVIAAGQDLAGVASSEQLYSRDNLPKIEVFIAEDAWERLRFSWQGTEQKEQEGKSVSVKSEYQPELADVAINGVRVAKVGIRKKGWLGSLSAQRPSLKIRFDQYVKGQKFLGLQGLTLNNNEQDPALIRQTLAFEWFRRAGIAAPRCNLARLYVNGRYFGIYSNVESVNTSFLHEHFGSFTGTLYESLGDDFRIRAIEQFDAKTNKKTDDKSSLRRVAQLLEDLEHIDAPALSKLVDLDKFLNFWVAEMLLGHWDGYFGNANNFFVYRNPSSGLFEFIPWGTDQAFFDLNPFVVEKAPKITRGNGRLCAALYSHPAYRECYLTLVAKKLDNWWNAPALLAEVERAANLIRPHVLIPQGEFDEALSKLRAYVEGVAPQVATELKDPPTKWQVALAPDAPADQSGPPDWAGSVKAAFLVPFGEYNPTNVTVLNDTRLDIVWRGKRVDYPVQVGSAGYKQARPQWFDTPEMVIGLLSPDTGQVLWLDAKIDPALLARKTPLRLHKSQVVCWFGTARVGSPGFSVYGTVEGVMHAELIETQGTRYIKGT